MHIFAAKPLNGLSVHARYKRTFQRVRIRCQLSTARHDSGGPGEELQDGEENQPRKSLQGKSLQGKSLRECFYLFFLFGGGLRLQPPESRKSARGASAGLPPRGRELRQRLRGGLSPTSTTITTTTITTTSTNSTSSSSTSSSSSTTTTTTLTTKD